MDGPCTQYFYPGVRVMVKIQNNKLIYGDIQKWVTEAITQEKMIKYLWGKNPHWNDSIFDSIDWKAVDGVHEKDGEGIWIQGNQYPETGTWVAKRWATEGVILRG